MVHLSRSLPVGAVMGIIPLRKPFGPHDAKIEQEKRSRRSASHRPQGATSDVKFKFCQYSLIHLIPILCDISKDKWRYSFYAIAALLKLRIGK